MCKTHGHWSCGTTFCHDALVCLDKRYWRTKSFSQSIIINQLPCWKSVWYLFDGCKLSCVAAKAGVELDFLFFFNLMYFVVLMFSMFANQHILS